MKVGCCILWWIVVFVVAGVADIVAQQPLYIHYNIDKGLPAIQVYHVVQDNKGFVWFSTAMGVCRFDGSGFTTYTRPEDIPAIYVADLEASAKEELWLLYGQPDAAFFFQNSRYNASGSPFGELLPEQKRYFKQPVSCTLKETDLNTVWIGTWGGGVYRCTQYQTPQLRVQPLLSGKTITSIFKDREGNYWFTTLDDGVFLLTQPDVLTFTTADGLPANDLYTVTGSPYGQVWVGTGRGSVAYRPVDGGSWQVFENISNDNVFNRVNDISVDSDKQIWVATDGGLYFIDPSAGWFLLNLTPTTAFAPAENHQIWVGKYRFPTKINLKTGAETTVIPIQEQVNALSAVSDKLLWIGTSAGLYRHENGKNFYSGGKAPILAKPINDLQTDSMGRLWIATADIGILIKQQNTVIHLTTANGLNSNTCNAIFLDSNMRAWAATNKGLNRILMKEMDPATVEVKTYSRLDGLASDFVNDVWVNGDSVWVATVQGLTVLPVRDIPQDSISPPVYITSMSVWNNVVPPNPAYRLTYRQNNLSIAFTGLSYRSGGNLQYLYQMEGADTEWLKTAGTSVQYPALPPGKYLFKVAALDKWGRISKQPAIISIYITPPIWETWYFKLAVTLLFLGLALSIGYAVLSYYKNRNEWERRMIESEQMALRSQMNPHFIFNSLNAIQYFVTENDKVSANRYLSVFSTLIRKVLNYSQQSYISLEDEIEYLRLYLEIESLRFKDKFTCTLSVSPEILPAEIDIPPMLIQPYIENALHHGLLSKKEGSRLLNIHFEQIQPDVLQCVVTDNGIGRTKAKEQTRDREGMGIGSSNPQARLAILNRLLKKPIQVIITDLYDTDQEPAGTKVTIAIPVYSGA
ncbi:MAG: histidine kinase [Sphingobacteriales bacterium]|nr:MAG: histidine kinase [Sphingobacteriales bacterium]